VACEFVDASNIKMTCHKDTSTSPHVSPSIVSVRSDSFNEQVQILRDGPTPLYTLVETATALIDLLTANTEVNVYNYSKSQVKLSPVLSSMLNHVQECGGEASKCYVASTIYLCRCDKDEFLLYNPQYPQGGCDR
jgi:hypothetical protein